MRTHGKTLTKGVSKTRSKSISVGIEKLLKAKKIDKTALDTEAMVSFGSEILKIATYYEAPRHGTTTTSGAKLEGAEEGAPEGTLVEQVLAKPKKNKTASEDVSPEEFKVTKREAERAARRLADDKATVRRVGRNMGTFAALSPTVGTLAKGVAAAATSKGRRGQAALTAMRKAIKDRSGLVEKAVGGAGTGAALTALGESRQRRQSRETVEKYLKETRGRKPEVKKLKAVLGG